MRGIQSDMGYRGYNLVSYIFLDLAVLEKQWKRPSNKIPITIACALFSSRARLPPPLPCSLFSILIRIIRSANLFPQLGFDVRTIVTCRGLGSLKVIITSNLFLPSNATYTQLPNQSQLPRPGEPSGAACRGWAGAPPSLWQTLRDTFPGKQRTGPPLRHEVP